jgi:transcriptional regulator with XRE-family HTH domain
MGCNLFIKRVQARLKLNNVEFAEKMDVDAVTISNWRRGEYAPSVANLERMLAYLGPTLDDCLYLPGEVPVEAELLEKQGRTFSREQIDEMLKRHKGKSSRQNNKERRSGKDRRGLKSVEDG